MIQIAICDDEFLIFITIMHEDVLKAFEVEAFDYLIKPVKESALGIKAFFLADDLLDL